MGVDDLLGKNIIRDLPSYEPVISIEDARRIALNSQYTWIEVECENGKLTFMAKDQDLDLRKITLYYQHDIVSVNINSIISYNIHYFRDGATHDLLELIFNDPTKWAGSNFKRLNDMVDLPPILRRCDGKDYCGYANKFKKEVDELTKQNKILQDFLRCSNRKNIPISNFKKINRSRSESSLDAYKYNRWYKKMMLIDNNMDNEEITNTAKDQEVLRHGAITRILLWILKRLYT